MNRLDQTPVNRRPPPGRRGCRHVATARLGQQPSSLSVRKNEKTPAGRMSTQVDTAQGLGNTNASWDRKGLTDSPARRSITQLVFLSSARPSAFWWRLRFSFGQL